MDEKAYFEFVSILRELNATYNQVEKLVDLAKVMYPDKNSNHKTNTGVDIDENKLKVYANFIHELWNMGMDWDFIYKFATLALGNQVPVQ